MDKLDGFIAYVKEAKKYSVVLGVHCDYIADTIANREETTYEGFFNSIKNYPKWVQKDVFEAREIFEKDFCLNFSDVKKGDTVYWNLNDFDMVHPKSIEGKVTGITADYITVFSENNCSLMFMEEDFGGSVTKKPIFGGDLIKKRSDYERE